MKRVNERRLAMPMIRLISVEEEARIRQLIYENTWPNGWSGKEPLASLPFHNVNADGSVQTVMMDMLWETTETASQHLDSPRSVAPTVQ